jgi:hypothetical protein
MSHRSRITIRLAISLSALILSVAVAEVLLAVSGLQPLYAYSQHYFINHPDFGFTLRPNAVGTHIQPDFNYATHANSYGFRGDEPNPSATYRTMVLGDSYTMGGAVHEGENLVERTKALLQEQGYDIDLFNTAVDGYQTSNELAVLRTLLPVYRPQSVVLIFCWNDFLEGKSVVRDGFLIDAARLETPLWALRTWMNRHSHLYCFMKRLRYLRRDQRDEVLSIQGFTDAQLSYNSGMIRQMQQLCLAADIPFTVVLIPLRGIYEGTPAFQASKQDFIQRLQSTEIDVRDWTLELPATHRTALVFQNNNHWSNAGHIFFSKVLARLVMEQLQILPH